MQERETEEILKGSKAASPPPRHGSQGAGMGRDGDPLGPKRRTQGSKGGDAGNQGVVPREPRKTLRITRGAPREPGGSQGTKEITIP